VKQFFRWLELDGRVSSTPLAHLKKANDAIDRRRERRALSTKELRHLLKTASGAPFRFGMHGPERVLLYRLAVESGLRNSELRSLTASSFDLGGKPPTVTVLAAHSKRRREDVLPLRLELVEDLREHLSSKMPVATAFNMPPKEKTAKMLQADLKDAKITVTDAAGRVVDFHALRHTFLTNLARSGVHPRTAQSLARHSSITLTMDRYTHVLVEDETRALEALPDLLAEEEENVVAATGTDGKPGAECIPSGIPCEGGLDGISGDNTGQKGGESVKCENTAEGRKTKVSRPSEVVGVVRLELSTSSLSS